MRVERVELRIVELRLHEPFAGGAGEIDRRPCLLVRLVADGVEGWGECAAWPFPGYSAETTTTSWHVLHDFLAPGALGRTLTDLTAGTSRLGGVRGHPMAKAALEMAAWDARARAAGVPLRVLLGGTRRRVEVGVALGFQPSVEALVDRVERHLREGYGRVKLKVGSGRDVASLAAVRAAFPNLRLQVDANGSYERADEAHLRSFDAYDLLLLEQPLAADDLVGHAALQSGMTTAVALDESLGSTGDLCTALKLGSCRVANVKAARVGGLAAAVAMHGECVRQGVPAFVGGMIETNVGRAASLALASLPGFTLAADLSASDRYYRWDPGEPGFALGAGSTLEVPGGPGLGVTVDPGRLAPHLTAFASFPAR